VQAHREGVSLAPTARHRYTSQEFLSKRIELLSERLDHYNNCFRTRLVNRSNAANPFFFRTLPSIFPDRPAEAPRPASALRLAHSTHSSFPDRIFNFALKSPSMLTFPPARLTLEFATR
jgi:hypothetical protein